MSSLKCLLLLQYVHCPLALPTEALHTFFVENSSYSEKPFMKSILLSYHNVITT